MEKSIKNIVLNAINEELSDNDNYFNGLDTSGHESWSDTDKFQWTYRCWYSYARPNTTSMRTSLAEWLAGVPIRLPVYNGQIKELGQNPESFFSDCAYEILEQVGREYIRLKAMQYPELERPPMPKPTTLEGTFIPTFHD